MDTTKIKIERLAVQHVQDLCGLYFEVFKKRVEPSYFISKYQLNDPEQLQFSSIAYDDDTLIGMYGCTSLSFEDNDNPAEHIRLGCVCDFILREKYRGTGLFDQLYFNTLEFAKLHLDGMIGFQSEQTYKVCQRHDWKDMRFFNRYHLRISGSIKSKVVNTISRNKVHKEIETLKSQFGDQFDINTLNRKRERITAVYDERFLRSKELRDHIYLKMHGVHCVLKCSHHSSIGYIQLSEKYDLQAFLDALRSTLNSLNEIVFHVQSDSAEDIALSEFLQKFDSFKTSGLIWNKNHLMDRLHMNFIEMDIY